MTALSDLSNLRVLVPQSIVDAVNGEQLTRPATLADLRAVLEAQGAETVDTGWHPMKTFGDGPGVYFAPGRYLVWRVEEVDSDG